ncbi:MAG TPA: cytochrome b [Sphingomonas sp.]|nr:cytochrome b [Sphingomonas sp.]
MATVPHATDQRRVLLRYNDTAIALHWLTVVLILAQLYVGFTFADMPRGPQQAQWFTWHKTIGATILVLSLIRLAWRLAHEPPPFPEDLPRWERIAAVWNHRIFYVLLIALPLTGLATISAGHAGTTSLLGGVPLPLIPGVTEPAGDTLGGVHEALVFITIALVVLHVAAALKHQFVDRARVAGRMPPFRTPGDEPVEPLGR